jgi:hypothetical protein
MLIDRMPLSSLVRPLAQRRRNRAATTTAATA